MAKAEKKSPGPDHNLTEEQKQARREEQVFFQGLNAIKILNSDMASTKGDIGATYKRLKDAGWTKPDIKFAQSLADKDIAEVIRDMQKKIRIAQMLGHPLGFQMDLLDKDRTPAAERAYAEGLAAGKMRNSASNPYSMETPQGQEWQRGFNDGTAFINAELGAAVGGGEEDNAPD